MKKEIISTDKAPGALGPYSQAVVSGDFIYVSGQLGIDPEKGKMVEGGVEAEARQAVKNLVAVLKTAGCSAGSILKTTIFLTDLGNFSVVNGIYGEIFNGDYPARSTVEVSGLPAGGLVEIEAIARR
ncbi:MAG: RidA family protein [Spirochaetales bacterium]|nr:RidA family protein [Spirochaetales bacterium]